MKMFAYFTDVRKYWDSESSSSKCVVLVSLLLVVMAYLPTLQFDYAPGDQWRAFRYPEQISSYDRWISCTTTKPPFFVRSGRPLAWIGECIDHAVVEKISDFVLLRPIALAIVLVTVIYLGLLVSPLVGGLAMGTMVATLFCFLPGYAFMYYLGMAAAPIIFCLIPALASFSMFQRHIHRTDEIGHGLVSLSLLAPMLLFVSACLIYPAWALIVIPLMWLYFGLDTSRSIYKRARQLKVTIVFYLVAVIAYYVLVKLLIAFDFLGSGTVDMGDGRYELSPVTNPHEIFSRLLRAGVFIINEPVANYTFGRGLVIAGLVSFSCCIGFEVWKNDKNKIFCALLWVVGSLFASLVVLSAAIAPWLFSTMPEVSTRFFMIVHLFSIVSIAAVISVVVNSLSNNKPLLSLYFMGVILLTAVAEQNKRSFLEVTVSGIEVEAIRLSIGAWLDNKGYTNSKLLLIVPPTPKKQRPAFIERLLTGSNIGSAATWSGDYNHYIEIVSAVLRERNDHPVGRELEIANCGIDHNCSELHLSQGEVVFEVFDRFKNKEQQFKTSEKPFIINISSLTAEPFFPKIEIFQRVAPPSVSASSQLREYGPQGLFMEESPGWHAEQNPRYPQLLDIDLHEIKSFSSISFLPQDPTTSARAPKSIRVKASEDGKSWVTVAASDDVCVANAPGGWHSFKLPNQIKTRFLEIEILANCGDPNFLTLRGLRIE
jgi:F5/8 type C domain